MDAARRQELRSLIGFVELNKAFAVEFAEKATQIGTVAIIRPRTQLCDGDRTVRRADKEEHLVFKRHGGVEYALDLADLPD
jgi:hypothetical protein